METKSLLVEFLASLGLAKLIGFGAALIGAALMVAFRHPKNKKELFYQALVALGCSLLFGGFASGFVMHMFTWAAEPSMMYSVIGAVHGLIGALSWGIFGALASVRDRLSKDPVKLAKDVKDIL